MFISVEKKRVCVIARLLQLPVILNFGHEIFLKQTQKGSVAVILYEIFVLEAGRATPSANPIGPFTAPAVKFPGLKVHSYTPANTEDI